MTRLIPLDSTTFVAGQIRPEDVAAVAATGVTMIVNNRPDGEEPGQPAGDEIHRAAEAAGLAYRHIPVSGGIATAQVEAMADALDAADGRLLAFCRSGTRSTHLWALARANRGADGDALIAQALAGGYDLSSIRDWLIR